MTGILVTIPLCCASVQIVCRPNMFAKIFRNVFATVCWCGFFLYIRSPSHFFFSFKLFIASHYRQRFSNRLLSHWVGMQHEFKVLPFVRLWWVWHYALDTIKLNWFIYGNTLEMINSEKDLSTSLLCFKHAQTRKKNDTKSLPFVLRINCSIKLNE